MSSTSRPRSTRRWSSTWPKWPPTMWFARPRRSRRTCSGTPPASATPTSRGSSGSPPGPRRWPRTGTIPPMPRTPSTSTTRCRTTAWSTTPATSTSDDVVKAIVVREPGGPDALEYQEVPDPAIGPEEVLVDVAATAVNRADLLQRQGFYNPPPGASDVMGLECSGTVAAVGGAVTGHQVGDQVCALLSGGGYATRVAIPAGQVMPVPDGVDLVTAGALPEVACTVWSNVFMIAGLQRDETLLVHGGAGGIGTFTIQLAHALGARVVTTAGSPEKLDVCRSLGADVAVNYKEQDFVEEVKEATDGAGADVILDN